MDNSTKDIIWSQLGASIDMLENAIVSCPDEIWNTGSGFQDFWYILYHTLFFLEFNLSDSPDNFIPPLPFGLSELDPEGIFPDRIYTKVELQNYCQHCRTKCRDFILDLSEEKEKQHFVYGSINLSYAEMLLYSMRHVQHHAGQLNFILRQKADLGSIYVKQAKDSIIDSFNGNKIL